jgi:hypothetical protein
MDEYKVTDSLIKEPVKDEIKEQIPFTQCLIHETKKAYKYYVIGILSSIGVILSVVFELWLYNTFSDSVINLFKFCIQSILNYIFSIDILIYIALLVLILPLDYSVIKCCLRRMANLEVDVLLGKLLIFYVIIALLLIISSFFIMNFYMFITGVGMLFMLMIASNNL